MTSYILREPAYHKSAKLAAKLARIDNLGYASDIRLQSSYGKSTYDQSGAPNTASVETQYETNPIGSVIQPSSTTQTTTPQLPTNTVADRTPPPSAPIVGATSETPSVVRSEPTRSPPSIDLNELKSKLSSRSSEQERLRNAKQWPENIMERLRRLVLISPQGRIDLNRGKNRGIKPLYTLGSNPQKIEGVSLWVNATDVSNPVLHYRIREGPQAGDTGVLTPDIKKFGIEKGNIDINRAISDFVDAKHGRLDFTGVGLKQSKPTRKNTNIHWEDRIMAGDANYVLRNPFLSGRISYYPYGAHMNQILIRQPTRHAMNIVRDLVENHTFKQSDYDMLQKEEGDKINQIIKLSNVVIPHDVKLKGYHLDDIVELKQRYKVLVGEIMAGNHGELVLDEMRDIVKQLAKYRAISEPTKRKMLYQIDSVK